jgi:hypothetical protein
VALRVLWKTQFLYPALKVLVAGKVVIDVAASPVGLPVGKLKILELFRFRWRIVDCTMLFCQKQIKGFLALAGDIVLNLGVRAAWLPWGPLGRFCSIVEAGQVDQRIATPDKSVKLLDREDVEAQKRVFDFPAITAELSCSRGDEHLGVLSHFSGEILSDS